MKSLDEFAALFKSTNPVAAAVTTKLSAELRNTASSLSTLVQAAVENHVAGAYWNADDVWTGFCHRVEAEVDQAHYLAHSVDLTGIGTWLVEHDPSICIIEVRATVQVSVDVNVEFFVYDTIDHDELNFGSLEVTRNHEMEVDVFITLRGDLEHVAVDELDPSIELAGGEYDVEVGEVDPDFGEESYA